MFNLTYKEAFEDRISMLAKSISPTDKLSNYLANYLIVNIDDIVESFLEGKKRFDRWVKSMIDWA